MSYPSNQPNNKGPSFLRSLSSIVLVLYLFLLISATIFVLVLNKLISDQETQRQLLQQTNFVAVIKPFLFNKAFQSLSSTQQGMISTNASFALQKKLSEAIISDSWVQAITLDALDSFNQWLKHDSQSEMPIMVIDTAPIKQNILSSQGKLAILTLIQKYPPCDPENTSENAPIVISQCLPANTDLNKFATENSILLSSLIPKEIQIETKQILPRSFISLMLSLRSAAQNYVWMGSILLILALLMIAITGYLYRTLLKQYFIILSLPFYLSAGFFLLLYIVWSVLINEYYRWYTMLQLTQDEAINQLVARLGAALITVSVQQSLAYSFAILAVGIVLSAASAMIKTKINQPESRQSAGRIRQQYR